MSVLLIRGLVQTHSKCFDCGYCSGASQAVTTSASRCLEWAAVLPEKPISPSLPSSLLAFVFHHHDSCSSFCSISYSSSSSLIPIPRLPLSLLSFVFLHHSYLSPFSIAHIPRLPLSILSFVFLHHSYPSSFSIAHTLLVFLSHSHLSFSSFAPTHPLFSPLSLLSIPRFPA